MISSKSEGVTPLESKDMVVSPKELHIRLFAEPQFYYVRDSFCCRCPTKIVLDGCVDDWALKPHNLSKFQTIWPTGSEDITNTDLECGCTVDSQPGGPKHQYLL
jgi:hypothetical protein